VCGQDLFGDIIMQHDASASLARAKIIARGAAATRRRRS